MSYKLSHFEEYLEFYVTLAYSDPCHTQNPDIFRTRDIFTTLSRHIVAYSECCVMLAYFVTLHIQNFVIFRILPYIGLEEYSESCLLRAL